MLSLAFFLNIETLLRVRSEQESRLRGGVSPGCVTRRERNEEKKTQPRPIRKQKIFRRRRRFVFLRIGFALMLYCSSQLTRLDTMEHRRQRARAVLAVVAAEVERLADFESHVAEATRRALVDGLSRPGAHVLLAGTAPADWAAVVGLDVNRNAALGESPRLGQGDAAVDPRAVLVGRHGSRIVEALGAVALVAVVLRKHSLALAIRPPFEMTSRELVDVII